MAAKPKKGRRKVSDNTQKKQRLVSERSKANLKPWEPGKSGNPAGRPKGSRNKLAEDVLRDFCALWDASGLEKLMKVAAKDPSTFVRLAVSLVPKQLELDARAAVYHIADRHLTNDEWARKWAEQSDSVEPPARPAKRTR